jgi:hypothetical protein
MPFAVLLALLVAGCGDDDGGSDATSGGDPFGLSSLDLPSGDAEVLRVFENMPEEISGVPRESGGEPGLLLFYGSMGTIVAFSFSPNESGETLAEDLSQFEDETDAVVEASQLDPDSGVLWLMGSFTDSEGGVVHLAVWGEPDGASVFNVSAQSQEMRDAIVRSFVEAVRATD